jgi:hypothetical protein
MRVAFQILGTPDWQIASACSSYSIFIPEWDQSPRLATCYHVAANQIN